MKIEKTPVVRVITALIAIACLVPALMQAEVRLPRVFTDNMVLQQGMSVPVWGWADDGEQVTVKCQGRTVTTVAQGGKWMVRLPKLKVAHAAAPVTLVVEGKNRIEFKNVLVGEVWICSGQSNMEWPLRSAFESDKDIAASANPNIRLLTVEKARANEPKDDFTSKGGWEECQPSTVPGFSAVGYYFGRALQKARNVPVGLIHTSWGGSPAEVWMDYDSLASYPDIRATYDKREEIAAKLQAAIEAFNKKNKELQAQGQKPTGRPPGRSWMPTELYNAMIHPLVPYAVKGAIWYQGESNAGRAFEYRSLILDMIKNWQVRWQQPEFYFFQVQLAPFMDKKTEPEESSWAELREAQLLATKVPGNGLAVITDVGEEKDIHPRKKGPVGERLALAARGIAYKERGLVYSGPVYQQMTVQGGKAILSFDHVGDGLVARDGELKGFAICGEDRKWVWGKAEITGAKNDTVTVSSPAVPNPVAVRYGWANFPEVNLWNKNGLPATPFRTDDFPMVTGPKPAAK